MSTIPVRKRRPRSEEQIDDTIDDSFPASDPPSYSRTARSGSPQRGETLDRVPCEDEADGEPRDPDQDTDESGKADDSKASDKKDSTV